LKTIYNVPIYVNSSRKKSEPQNRKNHENHDPNRKSHILRFLKNYDAERKLVMFFY